MQQSSSPVSSRPRGKVITLSVKQRMLLHRLLFRDLNKCTTSALTACQRLGWVFGAGSGYELTPEGRQVAEFSELAPPERTLELVDREMDGLA